MVGLFLEKSNLRWKEGFKCEICMYSANNDREMEEAGLTA